MFCRYFTALCIVACLCLACTQVGAVDSEVEGGGSGVAVKIVTKIIGSLFTGAAISCLEEAAVACKAHWKDPKAALCCAKEFLVENKGRCATSK